MYYFLFIYLLFLLFFINKIPKEKIFLLVFVPFSFVTVLRYGVGADYFSYERIYYNLNVNDIYGSLASMPKVEVLFKIINLISKKIGLSYHFFISIVSLSLLFISLKNIKDNSPNFIVSSLLYLSMLFIYWNLSAVRQGIVLILMMDIYFNNKKNYSAKTKVLSTIILYFMHPTAILVPIIYIISSFSWGRKKFTLLLLIAPIVKIFLNPKFLIRFDEFALIKQFLYYSSYNSINLISFPSLLRFGFIIFILFHYDLLKKKYPDYLIMLNFTLFNLIMYFFLPFSMVVGTRVTIFGYYLTVIIFPMILNLYSSKHMRTVILSCLIVWSSVSFLNEMIKVTDRTGYIYSPSRLNFETVFQKNRNHFNNAYAFHLDIEDLNGEKILNAPIISKVNNDYRKVETIFNKNMEYLSVRFSNNKFGVIDSRGKVILLPEYRKRMEVFSNIVVEEKGNSIFNSNKYFLLDSFEEKQYSDSQVSNKINKSINQINEYASGKWLFEEVDITYLNDIKFLERININSLTSLEKYTNENNTSYSYLKLRSRYDNYYIILKDGQVLVDKVYNNIVPINYKGIIIGETSFGTEFINEVGDVFWFEYSFE